MRKLIILKSLLDFIWIVSCIPLIPLGLFFSIYMFYNDEIIEILFRLNGSEIIMPNPALKVFLLLLIGLIFVIIYCIYTFRITLRFFQQRKAFDIRVINNFNKIGVLLAISGIVASFLSFIFKVFFENKFQMNLSLSSYLLLACLGLFFMVLSEIFKISKKEKEENELTI